MLKMHRSQKTEKEIWIRQNIIKPKKFSLQNPTAFYLKNKTKSIIDILPLKVCIWHIIGKIYWNTETFWSFKADDKWLPMMSGISMPTNSGPLSLQFPIWTCRVVDRQDWVSDTLKSMCCSRRTLLRKNSDHVASEWTWYKNWFHHCSSICSPLLFWFSIFSQPSYFKI